MVKYISKEQYEKLKKELERLKIEERMKVAEKIKKAKEFGDLSENSEYVSALEEQKNLERKIFELENLLKQAKIVKENNKKDEIQIGSKIKIKDLNTGKEINYEIVGFGEADPLNGKISTDSPIGKALLGKKVGDELEIELPKKTLYYKILEIS